MMFFLARSALCIGVVAGAASGIGTDTETWPLATALDRGARQAADRVGRVCLASDDCLRAGTGALAAAARDIKERGDSPAEPDPRRLEARGSRRASPAGG